MARKISPLEEQLIALPNCAASRPRPQERAEVAKYLGGKINLLAAKAARIAGEWQAAELVPDLAAAFERFLVKPETTDKRCEAKTEILKALCKMEYSIAHRFSARPAACPDGSLLGRPVDTAAEVRALSAMGLAQTDYPGGAGGDCAAAA